MNTLFLYHYAKQKFFHSENLKLVYLLILLAGITLLAGCGGKSAETEAAEEAGLTPLIIQTDWYAQPEHGGIYQAMAKGYYAAEGLAIEVREGANLNTIPQLVATGKVDIAMSRSDTIIIAASRGIPLICVAAHMQHDPQGLIFHKESGIESFKDLAGRNVMIAPGAAMTDIIKKKFNIDFNLIPMDWGLSQFLNDKQFVQQCFITSEPYYLKQQGANPKTFLISETGFDPYRVFYTSQSTLDKKSEALKKFIRATNKGWVSFLEEAYPAGLEEISRRNPKITKDFALWTINVMKEHKLVEGYPEQGDAIGKLDPERFQKNIDMLESIGLMEGPLTLEQIMKKDFM